MNEHYIIGLVTTKGEDKDGGDHTMLSALELGQTCEQNFWYMYVCLTQWAVGCLATETFFTSETDKQEVKKTYSVICIKGENTVVV